VRVVAVVLTLAALAASAAAQAREPAAGEATATSGLYGFVRRGPPRPVCRVGQLCRVPLPNATLVFSSDGAVVARTRTRRDGSYRLALAASWYTVRLSLKLIVGYGLRPSRVTVPQGRFARVDFFVDSRIR
jgi:hypothetical protein